MFYYTISGLLLRCLQRDFNVLLRSGYNFIFNFIFLYNLKSSLEKIRPDIENVNKSKKKILIDCYPNSLIYLYALLIHTFPSQNIIIQTVLYCSNFSFTKSYLFSCLKNYKVIYLDSFVRNIVVIIKNFKTLKIEFFKIQKIKKNQFDYEFDGISFGKIGYDNYLRKQMYGKLRNLSIYKYHVFLSVIYYLNAKNLIKKNILIYSGKETQFLPRSVVLQTCLKTQSNLIWSGGLMIFFQLEDIPIIVRGIFFKPY